MKQRYPKKQPQEIMDESPVGAFDDALPTGLAHEIAPDSEGEVRVPLRPHAEAQVSPFIVRLSRDGERESLSGEAPLVEISHEDPLALTAEDLRDQFLETDTEEMPEIPVIAFDKAKELPEAPMVVLDFADTDDIFAVLDGDDAEEQVVESPAVAFLAPDEVEAYDEPVAIVLEQASQKERVVTLSLTRAVASFVLVAILLVLPLQAMNVFASTKNTASEIEDGSAVALESFLRGTTSLGERNFDSASDDFSDAAAEFAHVEESLDDMHAAVVAVVNVIPKTERTVTSVRSLVTAGEELSETAEILALAGEDIAGQDSLDLVSKMGILSAYVEELAPHVDAAEAALKHVDPEVVPLEYRDKVAELETRIPQVAASTREFLVFTDALTTVLGGNGKVRYLVAFQNNTELRPTGGFVGSFAEIDLHDGAIENMRIPGGGSYSTQGQLTEFVAAPGPLQLLKARWEFQDANWFPDFPSSADKMLWFLEHSGEPTMDGVISVNATFMEELLEILGPVDMPEYGRTITAENFLLETQKIVELEYDKTENAPKAFIGDLAPILLNRLTDADLPTLLSVMNLMGKALEEKDVMIYFRDNDLEASMESLGWSGSMKETDGDFLMPVSTNLGGGKTDGVIDQHVKVDVHIAEDGTVENTVTIMKEHHGMKSALFSGVNNVDYLRLYVPKGSVFLTGSGFEAPTDDLFEVSDIPLTIDEDLSLHMQDLSKDAGTGTDIWEEDGKTVFGNWMQTAPGETETVSFTYRLPFKIDLSKTENGFLKQDKAVPYSLFIQKQPGVEHRVTEVTVTPPTSVGVLWTSSSASDNLTAHVENDRDAFVAWLLEPR